MLVVLINLIKSVFSPLHPPYRFFKIFAYAFLCIAATVIIFKTMTPAETEKAYVIAITQFVEHPALDEEREAIIKTLRASLEPEKKLIFIYQNAQGNVATAVQIAAQLASGDPKPDLIIAIATPSAQAVAPEAAKYKIPMVFTAVTDPVQAKLVKSLDKQEPDAMITGVSDALPVKELLEFVRAAVPNLKALGVVYNPGESNSASQVREIQAAVESFGLTLVLAAATRTADVAAATESLIGRVDAILIPNDNTAVAAIESAIRVAEKNAVPIFAADFGSVDRGVAAAIGYTRQDLGQETGNVARDIINGKSPSQIPVKHSHAVQIKINERAAERMKIALPPALLQKAIIVNPIHPQREEQKP
jgi:putative ABC transport system substrate-binding protein